MKIENIEENTGTQINVSGEIDNASNTGIPSKDSQLPTNSQKPQVKSGFSPEPEEPQKSDYGSKSTIKHVALAAVIIILLVGLIFLIYKPTANKAVSASTTTIKVYPTVSLTAPFINNSINMSVYYLDTLISPHDFPVNVFYTYFNSNARTDNYYASYAGNYSFSSTNNTLNSSYVLGKTFFDVETNGTLFYLRYTQNTTPPPVSQTGNLSYVAGKYYWCIPTCYIFTTIPNMSSITKALVGLNLNITPEKNNVKIYLLKNESYHGNSCIEAYGTFNYTMKGMDYKPDYVDGNFSECFSKQYGFPLNYSSYAESPILKYHFGFVQTGFRDSSGRIIAPKNATPA